MSKGIAAARPGVERRTVKTEVEFRAAPAGSKSPGTLAGYAAKFNAPSVDLGGFVETIQPGAFAGCLGDDVRALKNHDDNLLLGRSTAGTLRFEEDGVGLRVEIDLPDTTAGRDTAEEVGRRDLKEMSFQFVMPADGSGDRWDFTGPVPLRTVVKVSRLYDVGPVVFPAYEDTEVSLRSADTEAARRSLDAARARDEERRRAADAAARQRARNRVRVREAELPPC